MHPNAHYPLKEKPLPLFKTARETVAEYRDRAREYKRLAYNKRKRPNDALYRRRRLGLIASFLLVSGCGLLDPGAQQRLIYGPQAAVATRDDIARSARIDAGIALIQKGVNERDPARADHYITIGERLLE